jgi:hypothetical protein
MPRRVTVEVHEDAGGEARVEIRLPKQEERPGPPPGWLVLQPLTARVVRLLCVAGWLSREEIAARLGESAEGKLRELLTDLAERKVLESSSKKGYQLLLPDDRDPEAFRREVLAWLDSIHPPCRAD